MARRSCFFFLLPLLVAALAGSPVVTAQRNALPAAAASVRVGVILNLTSAVGVRRRVGIQMAVEDYYAANPGSATRVELHFRDSAGDVLPAASAGKLAASPIPCSN
jgi:hypothetical protein